MSDQILPYNSSSSVENSTFPLVVDLDGTLILTDMLYESWVKLFRDNPLEFFKVSSYLFKGKAEFKAKLAQNVELDVSLLPYNTVFIDWLRIEKSKGRQLILCTGSDQVFAESIANHLGIFDAVIASDGKHNVSGSLKAAILEDKFGVNGFVYAGNAAVDLAVWEKARAAIVVNGKSSLLEKAKEICDVEECFSVPTNLFNNINRVLRTHQWMKNFLLFIPLFAGHEFLNLFLLGKLFLGFISFSLCASAVYVVNDLLDLESDRLHPRKRKRPFASGNVPILHGFFIGIILLFLSYIIGTAVGGNFLFWLCFYFTATCAYSLGLKRVVLVDCLMLALLYTLRIVAGAAAISNNLSFWLIAFSVFIFLSLAFVKRYAEIMSLLLSDQVNIKNVHGRGYTSYDAPLIQTKGIVSGYTAVLVLALYLNSDEVLLLYPSHEIVWGAVPIMLFWISWMWLQASRGNMHDDPLIFAVKDLTSVISGGIFITLLTLGSTRLLW